MIRQTGILPKRKISEIAAIQQAIAAAEAVIVDLDAELEKKERMRHSWRLMDGRAGARHI
jgi:hypothetical protein